VCWVFVVVTIYFHYTQFWSTILFSVTEPPFSATGC